MADNLTKKQRSFCMSSVRNRDTDLEQIIRSEIHRRGFRFRKHVSKLPGKPDMVFSSSKLAVFLDGDFWHGYRFPLWKKDVSAFWQKKIALNRARDQKNFRKLRAMGWRVIRLWQHQITSDFDSCINKITKAVDLEGFPNANI